jgi:hypothetical protein
LKNKERVITGAAEVAVPGRTFLLAVGPALGAVHVEDDAARRLAVMDAVQAPDRSARVSRLASLANHSVSKRSIWLLELVVVATSW